MKNKIKIALVGFGAIAKRHVEAINHHEEFCELVEICEINKDVLQQQTSSLNIKGYSSLEGLLDKSSCDYIVLCTPNGFHFKQAIQSAEAGFNVITEKPMALNYQDALLMVKTFKRLEKKLFVVKQVRLLKRIQLIKDAVDNKHFGKIYLSNFNLFWSRPQKFYDEAKWRGTKELDGGTLLNQAIHYIDLMIWLLGPVSTVSCFSSTLARNIEVEDTAVINLNFLNGSKGSFNVTTLTYPKNLECSFTIIGEKGTVKIGGPALDKIEEWTFEDNFGLDIVKKDKQGFDHINFYDGIIKDHIGEKKFNLTGEDAIETIKVIGAALESSSSGKQIKLI